MARLTGKVALITGGGSGLGAGAAALFAAEGAKVAICDIRIDRAHQTAEAVGHDAFAVKADVTNEDDVAAAVAATIDRFGRIDIMINNAGILGAVGSLTEIALADWERTIAVHLTGTFLGLKHAGRAMKAQGSGSIVSLASTAGVLGGLGPHAYTAAKHAIVGLTKSAASEFASFRVRVNAVAPGGTVSEMTSLAITGDRGKEDATAAAIKAGSPLGFAAEPKDVAEALAFLASDAARNITGQTLAVDAGQTTMVVQPGGFNFRGASLFDVR